MSLLLGGTAKHHNLTFMSLSRKTAVPLRARQS